MAKLDFKLTRDSNNQKTLHTSITGKLLLTTPQLNKGTAFSKQERLDFDLLGKLPAKIETVEEQTQRAYSQFQSFFTDFNRHIYLNRLHDTNQVLFYNLVNHHLDEMLNLLYTPHVATAVENFSDDFRQARGLYISYDDGAQIQTILENRSNPEIDLIVVTDGEAVLGIGDQGVGAINIPIAKLMVYTLCAGINPLRTLPIVLDVGTDNQTLLNNPNYLGLKTPRIRGEKYKAFIDKFINAVCCKLPNAFLHWEDFSAHTALENLSLCQNRICSFNDDIEGTGAAALATIAAACRLKNEKINDQRFIIFGAGTAGTGITEAICQALIQNGLSETEAIQRFCLIDRYGLITAAQMHLTPLQKKYAKESHEIKNYNKDDAGLISLLETITQFKPTVLIGCSGVANAFDEASIKKMNELSHRPLIMPLSNPTTRAEANPADIIQWTDAKALVATGSPFAPVTYNNQEITIGQCNNALIFPAIGLGVIAAKAKKLSPKMLQAAYEALSRHAPILQNETSGLLPKLKDMKPITKKIAIAIVKTAKAEGLANLAKDANVETVVTETMWLPEYYPFKKI